MPGPLSTLATASASGSQTSLTLTLTGNQAGDGLVLTGLFGLVTGGGTGAVTITDNHGHTYNNTYPGAAGWDFLNPGVNGLGALRLLVPPAPLVSGDSITITWTGAINNPSMQLVDWDAIGEWIGYPTPTNRIYDTTVVFSNTATLVPPDGANNGPAPAGSVAIAFCHTHATTGTPSWAAGFTAFGSTLSTANGKLSTGYRILPSDETPSPTITWTTTDYLTFGYLVYLSTPAYIPDVVCPASTITGDTVTIPVSNPPPGDHIEYSLDLGSSWTTAGSLPIMLTLGPGAYTIWIRAANSVGVGDPAECSFTVVSGEIQITCTDGTIIVGGVGYPPTWTWTSPNDPPVIVSPPTITSFTPSSGAVGDTITVTGTNYIAATSVLIGSTACSFTVVDATHITLVIPPGATTGRIKITTAGGSATSATDLTVTTTRPPPTPSFGFDIGIAEGNIPKATTEASGLASPPKRTKFVATCAAILGPGGVNRTSWAIGIDNTGPPTPTDIANNWPNYDAYASLCETAKDADGVTPAPQRMVAELHWNWQLSTGNVGYYLPDRDATSGHPTYISGASARLQGMKSWYDWVHALVMRYGDRVSDYEIWNEPDTPTGNANGSQTAGYMNPADVYELARSAAMAIRAAWAAGGFAGDPTIYLPSIGAIETSYLRKIVEYGKGNGAAGTWVVPSSGSMINPVPGQPHYLSFGDVMPFHVYMGEDPTLAGGVAGSPVGTSDTLLRRVKTLETRGRPYLDSEGYTADILKLCTTEGGYRGNDTDNYDTDPSVSTLDDTLYATVHAGKVDQGTYEQGALDYLQSKAQTLGFVLYTHYKLVDKSPAYPANSADSVKHNALGITYDASTGDGAIGSSHWKPVANVLSDASRSNPGNGTAAFLLPPTDDGTIHAGKALHLYQATSTLTGAELNQIAADCDVIEGPVGGHGSSMFAANADLLVSEYGKGVEQSSTASEYATLPELGFEHNVGSGYGTANRAVVGGQAPRDRLMESTRTATFPKVGGLANANFARYRVRRRISAAHALDTAAGRRVITMLWFDRMGRIAFDQCANHAIGGNGPPFNPSTGLAYTDVAWLGMVRRFADTARDATINLDGYFVVANGVGVAGPEEQKMLSHVDLGMTENWLTTPTSTPSTYPSITRLENAIDLLIYADTVTSGVWVVEKAWGSAWSTALWHRRRRYSAAAFMLGNRGGSVFEFSPSLTSTIADQAPQLEASRDTALYGMNLGPPLSTPASAAAMLVTVGTLQGRASATGLYRRRFTNGIVLLNGTGSSITYVADTTMTNIDGGAAIAPGDVITIGANVGAFYTT